MRPPVAASRCAVRLGHVAMMRPGQNCAYSASSAVAVFSTRPSRPEFHCGACIVHPWHLRGFGILYCLASALHTSSRTSGAPNQLLPTDGAGIVSLPKYPDFDTSFHSLYVLHSAP